MKSCHWLTAAFIVATLCFQVPAAERVLLSESTWDEYVPQGKEVDCIYGDIVLRNDKIVAVVANPIEGRNANMTVRNVGGSVIDITQRSFSNDQLSAYFPGGAKYALRAAEGMSEDEIAVPVRSEKVSFVCQAAAEPNKPTVKVEYELEQGAAFLSIKTTYANPHGRNINIEPLDAIRADRSFKFGQDKKANLFFAYDEWWRQAVGVVIDGYEIGFLGDTLNRRRPVLTLSKDGANWYILEPGKSLEIHSKLFVAAHQLELQGLVQKAAGNTTHECEINVTDLAGPVRGARIELKSEQDAIGVATTDENGLASFHVEKGDYRIRVESEGRPPYDGSITAQGPTRLDVQMKLPGYVVAKITDGAGDPIPCKVEFREKSDGKRPYFGPDTKIYGIENLRYTHNGIFRQAITPGKYDVIVSHGNEYDAVFTQIDVEQGKDTSLVAQLKKSVQTDGWISGEFHSHSSPSGDNTGSQRGRVLNLLAEHIEFAPCTEHNRVSTYQPHLRFFNAEHLMASCSGIELTGQPLPVNHQNAFPILRKPRTQDGGGPQTDSNPLVQIERLALWDNRSEKLVQENHPNIAQIFGDRDTDGTPDSGFEQMFGFMDVVEVHPPQTILLKNAENPENGRQNRIFRWLQLLNLGYRIPGVVNTDAHYNFHGSGWLRNYIRSSTDNPAEISTAEMVKESEAGHIIMTNGPYLEVSAKSGEASAIAGDDLSYDTELKLDIKVQCANWLDINRVQIIVNGRIDEKWNFSRAKFPDKFHDGVVKFEEQISMKLRRDSHVIVVATGDGLKLGPVVGPSRQDDPPTAVSNPIFVDVDGDGFQPNYDQLGFPLPSNQNASGNPAKKWTKQIAKFKAEDEKSFPKENSVLFIGSSSIRLWKLQKYFPGRPTINRGFGGSQLSDSVFYANDIAIPYKPAAIVLYAGDNDIAAGETSQQVFDDYCEFVSKIHSTLPETRILFLAIKPSIKRWDKVQAMRKANELVRAKTLTDERLDFIDIDTPMIGDDGKPKKELFAKDGLHLNSAGYELWSKIVADHLDRESN